jgi:hypothetical protein
MLSLTTPPAAATAAAWLLLLLLQMRSGLGKKDAAASTVSRRLAAAAAQHEWLLFLLNFLNVGASLLLPCGMVLCNKVRDTAGCAFHCCSVVGRYST